MVIYQKNDLLKELQNLLLLTHQINFKECTSLESLVLDFRNYLVLFRPCISQCTGFN